MLHLCLYRVIGRIEVVGMDCPCLEGVCEMSRGEVRWSGECVFHLISGSQESTYMLSDRIRAVEGVGHVDTCRVESCSGMQNAWFRP